MLAPNDLLSVAEQVFSAPNTETAARAARFEVRSVCAAVSSSWRLLHQETPPPASPLPALFGETPAIPAQQIAITRVWSAHEARLVGRRGLVAEDGALFLGGPVRSEADLGCAIADSAAGGEGFVLRQQAGVTAQLLSPFANGERRLTGVGLHLGVAAGDQARPFMLDQFASLLLIAELRPKLDYIVLAAPDPDLASLLTELGLGGLKIFNLDRLPSVVCSELLVPIIARDPAGWVDTATIGRLRAFAGRAHAKLGPGTHTEPTKIFLADEDRADRPATRLAVQQGYQLRGLAGRPIVDQALIMAKASHVATDQADGVLATLFAAATVPVLDLAGGDPAERVPLLAGAGRPYAFADAEQAEVALARIAAPDQQAA